jgi:hypothetical protein
MQTLEAKYPRPNRVRIITQRLRGLKFTDESICSRPASLERSNERLRAGPAEFQAPSAGGFLLATGIGLMVYILVSDLHRIRESMIVMDTPHRWISN